MRSSVLIIFSFFFLLFSAYLHYASLSEIDLTPGDASFEYADQDDALDSLQGVEAGLPLSSNYLGKFLLAACSLKEFFYYFRPQSFPEEKYSILRC